ncbi:hypothetical protein CAEBREN_11608 [Caenorhabditis brenneri]|uniref:G-protein coupled receptors family 1 profile domain-containing protein n=1 Tax=Caenorhabditis brenneri TaxID=135651 RepID=G0P474_CAEBE|nr:hypothetical protein CAEBREN_11608 [Caenorhabditis brenneri]
MNNDQFEIFKIPKWLYQNGDRINYGIELATVLVNLFHLLILFQKSLRTNSIFILMIGICISDILGFYAQFEQYDDEGRRTVWSSNILVLRMAGYDTYLCLTTGYTEVSLLGILKFTLLYVCRPISIWLAILMALIRTLSIIFPMSNTIGRLTKTRNAVLMVLVVCVLWIVYYSWEYAFLKYWYLPDHIEDKGCRTPMLARNNTIHLLVLSDEYYNFYKTRDSLEYLVRLIPALFYPILTLSLMIELWRVKKRRKMNNMNQSKDNTTFLIFFMTLSFMLSEGLAGISNFVESTGWPIYESWWKFRARTFSSAFYSLRSFNALSHFFVCIAMSSQYRDTVTGLFCGKCKCRKKEKVVLVNEVSTKESKSFNSVPSKTY